jgi:lysylphosphatidylglycerol synthetase-like protein (DUF2156 family)
MQRSEAVLVVFLVVLVFGMFALADWNETAAIGAQVQADAAFRGQPKVEQAAYDAGMALAAKVIGGVLVGMLIAAGAFLYHRAEIDRLKNGGWARFWERRTVKERQPRTKQPSLTDLLTAMIARDVLDRKDRRR